MIPSTTEEIIQDFAGKSDIEISQFIYDIAKFSGSAPRNQFEELEFLQKLGFKVNTNFKLCQNIEEVINFWKSWHKKKDRQNYLIDGVVVKVNKIK